MTNKKLNQLTVVCVLWEGNFRKRSFNPEWVTKLKNMVKLHLPIPHNFICLSNVNVPCDKIPLKHNWPGWWSKIELFRPDLPIEGRILYIDLDSLIVDTLNSIVNYDSKFAVLPTYPKEPRFNYPVKSWTAGNKKLSGKTIAKYSTTIMIFNKGQGYDIYNKFNNQVMVDFRGDQDWVGYIQSNIDLLPAKWFCKLKHCINKPYSPDTKVIFSLPYKNDQAAELFPWVKEIWNV